MLEYISLNDWKTKTKIITELKEQGVKINERTWRLFVERNNKAYCNEETEFYIVHGKKGYKATKNEDEIIASINDLHSRALNMLWKQSQAKKALGIKDNLKIDLERMEII